MWSVFLVWRSINGARDIARSYYALLEPLQMGSNSFYRWWQFLWHSCCTLPTMEAYSFIQWLLDLKMYLFQQGKFGL